MNESRLEVIPVFALVVCFLVVGNAWISQITPAQVKELETQVRVEQLKLQLQQLRQRNSTVTCTCPPDQDSGAQP